MVIVAEGSRGRQYLTPTDDHTIAAQSARPAWTPTTPLPDDPRNFWTIPYGLRTFGDLFTNRQLVALTTLADLVAEARTRAHTDATVAFAARGLSTSANSLAKGGDGPQAYADAVATYLALAVSKLSDAQSSLVRWKPSMDQAIATFARQAIPMVWDYAESNTFSGMAGDFEVSLKNMMRVLDELRPAQAGEIYQINAPANSYPVRPVAISTDPPYYDNIGYADLSDFFYVWLKRSLNGVWPSLFRRIQTPKEEELVATPYRHGGKDAAEAHFMEGMGRALTAMRNASAGDIPLAIYYAFKQSEKSEDGVSSAGWASFLQAVVDSGLMVDGTWPMRTELANRMIGSGTNALASSIVLVCRPRAEDARGGASSRTAGSTGAYARSRRSSR
jgi:putative DNA methylase